MSTIEVEYTVIGETTKEVLWLTWLVRELDVEQGEVQLDYDSLSVIYLANNHVYHAKTKYIYASFHKISKLFASGQILLKNAHTSN